MCHVCMHVYVCVCMFLLCVCLFCVCGGFLCVCACVQHDNNDMTKIVKIIQFCSFLKL